MDKNIRDNLDNIFKEPLQTFQERPGRNVWENIEQELDKDKRMRFFSLSRDRAVRLGVACLICICVTVRMISDLTKEPVASSLQPPIPNAPVSRAPIPRAPIPHGPTPPGPTPSGPIPPGPIPHAPYVIDDLTALPARALVKKTQELASLGPNIQELAPLAYIQAPGLAPLKLGSSTATLALAPVPFNRINLTKNQSLVHLAGRARRWSMTGYFAQELAGYNLADHDSTAASGRRVDKKETSLFSASGGLLVGYRLSRKWMIQSGLIYSWSNSISDPSVAYAVTDNNGSTKYKVNTPTGYGYLPSSSPIGDSAETDEPSSRLHYLSMPLIASYTFDVRRRLTVLTGAGVIANLLTSAKVASKIQTLSSPQAESIVTLYGLRKINFGLFLKAEIQYAIRADWSVNLTVTSKNALTPINTNMTYSTFPYYVGLGIGMTHSF